MTGRAVTSALSIGFSLGSIIMLIISIVAEMTATNKETQDLAQIFWTLTISYFLTGVVFYIVSWRFKSIEEKELKEKLNKVERSS